MFQTLIRSFRKSIPVQKLETFLIPQPGEGIAEVEIIQWLVKPNDKVQEFQILCEARSDKGFIEYKSPYNGQIKELMFKPSEMAQIGAALFKIDIPESKSTSSSDSDSDQAPESSVHQQKEQVPEALAQESLILNGKKVLTTPAIRSLAKKHNLDLTQIKGSGQSGRILKEDILKYLENPRKPEESKYLENPKHVDPPPMPKAEYKLEDKVVKMTPIQRAMLKSMTEALSIPHLTLCEDIYVEQIMELRNQLKNNLKDIKLTYMPFFIKALSLAILDYPIVNSILADSKMEYVLKGSHNVSFAMDSPFGLIVPNVKNVESKSIYEIAKEMNRLQQLGLKGKLGDSDLKEGTITISNIGSIGGTYATPIIMPPQVFIGAFGTIRPRLEKVNGEIVEKHILTSGWSADHRVIDGATTARFVSRWKAIIENPSLMLLHLK